MKKILKIPKSKNEKIGLFTGLFDINNNPIYSGDYVRLISCPYYVGPVMWNRYQDSWGIFMRHKDYSDLLNPDNYAKFIPIHSDNGMRMNLIKVS